MKKGSTRFTVEHIRAGQPRPYANSYYEFSLSIESVPYNSTDGEFKPWDLNNDEMVKKYGKELGHKFYEKEEKPQWHQPILTSFKKVGPGVWNFVVVEEYTD